jgi:hypothetical protein
MSVSALVAAARARGLRIRGLWVRSSSSVNRSGAGGLFEAHCRALVFDQGFASSCLLGY